MIGGMILSPITMALGCYLAVSAHLEASRTMPDFFDDMDGPIGLPRGGFPRNVGRPASQPDDRLTTAPEDRQLPSPMPPGGRAFRGQSFKLGPDPRPDPVASSADDSYKKLEPDPASAVAAAA